jgi:hypothetical protein
VTDSIGALLRQFLRDDQRIARRFQYEDVREAATPYL